MHHVCHIYRFYLQIFSSLSEINGRLIPDQCKVASILQDMVEHCDVLH